MNMKISSFDTEAKQTSSSESNLYFEISSSSPSSSSSSSSCSSFLPDSALPELTGFSSAGTDDWGPRNFFFLRPNYIQNIGSRKLDVQCEYGITNNIISANCTGWNKKKKIHFKQFEMCMIVVNSWLQIVVFPSINFKMSVLHNSHHSSSRQFSMTSYFIFLFRQYCILIPIFSTITFQTEYSTYLMSCYSKCTADFSHTRRQQTANGPVMCHWTLSPNN